MSQLEMLEGMTIVRMGRRRRRFRVDRARRRRRSRIATSGLASSGVVQQYTSIAVCISTNERDLLMGQFVRATAKVDR